MANQIDIKKKVLDMNSKLITLLGVFSGKKDKAQLLTCEPWAGRIKKWNKLWLT